MKSVLSVSVLLGVLLVPTSTVAQSALTNTGPGSLNVIEEQNSSQLECVNTTEVDVRADADQEAMSGNADTTVNTSGGNAISGDARNQNEVEANVTLENTCGVGGSEEVYTTSTNDEVPAVGGDEIAAVAELPDTTSGSTYQLLAAAVASIVFAAFVGRVGIQLFGRK